MRQQWKRAAVPLLWERDPHRSAMRTQSFRAVGEAFRCQQRKIHTPPVSETTQHYREVGGVDESRKTRLPLLRFLCQTGACTVGLLYYLAFLLQSAHISRHLETLSYRSDLASGGSHLIHTILYHTLVPPRRDQKLHPRSNSGDQHPEILRHVNLLCNSATRSHTSHVQSTHLISWCISWQPRSLHDFNMVVARAQH
jgi:hypothetical protein